MNKPINQIIKVITTKLIMKCSFYIYFYDDWILLDISFFIISKCFNEQQKHTAVSAQCPETQVKEQKFWSSIFPVFMI